MSLALNLGLTPLLSGLLPHHAVLVVNAAVLVAVLNWALLPVLHWITGGWALRTPSTPDAGRRPHAPRDPGADPLSRSGA